MDFATLRESVTCRIESGHAKVFYENLRLPFAANLLIACKTCSGRAHGIRII